MKKILLTTLFLSAAFLCGCSGMKEQLSDYINDSASAVTAGQTISNHSKWINSEIDGAITADTPTRIQDDFYTAVNRSWILEQQISKDAPNVSFYDNIENTLEDQTSKLLSISPEDTTGLDPNIMSESQLIGTQKLVFTFADLASDWETRNKNGAEPLRRTLEELGRISDLSEMTSWIENPDGSHLLPGFLISFSMEAPVSDKDTNDHAYTVMLTCNAPLTLKDPDSYKNIGGEGIGYMERTNQAVTHVLGKLDYTPERIRQILKQCYRFEIDLKTTLANAGDVTEPDYFIKHNHQLSKEELANLQGNYPLTEILDSYGLGNSDSYTVPEPDSIQKVGRLYNISRLEELKSYYIVHTILAAMDLLDQESYNTSQVLSPKTQDNDDAQAEEENSINPFVMSYLSAAYQEIYIGHYCSESQKQALTELAMRIQDDMGTVLKQADFLGEETRKKALEKLNAVCLHILYPDQMPDYSSIVLAKDDTLVSAAAKIKHFELMQLKNKVNQPADRNWDLNLISTLDINAYYMPTENSINILAGYVAGGYTFSASAPLEKNLAIIGYVIGHEITHGFDTSGYEYDKDGRYLHWWSYEDQEQFQIRADRMQKYYSSLTPIPGSVSYSGSMVVGEAIADMGGIKCVLIEAAKHPDFDYDRFFRFYAAMHAAKRTYRMEQIYSNDTHPLNFLRVNVTLQQFDEFLNTYDIQPGDGMYLAPEDRIRVW